MNIQEKLKLIKDNTLKKAEKNMSEKMNMSNISNFLYGVKKDFLSIQTFLRKECNEYTDNVFQYKNYVLMPAKEDLVPEIEREALKLDIFNSSSTIRLKEKIRLENNANLYVFRIGDCKEELYKYNPSFAKDSAKTDFYKEMKRLIEIGKIDKIEISDEKLWYMNKDGRKIYNISPNLTGIIPVSEREAVIKNIFNKIFNQK